jgi:release factor glutamine methyltransferase
LSTIYKLFLKGRALLKDKPHPHIEAKLLLLECASISEEQFYSSPDRELSRARERRFFRMISKRLHECPIPYLIGKKEFWSISFNVSPAVMIPRSETELIVEKVLEIAPRQDMTIVDIGTGCGNIAVSLAKELPKARIVATDISERALKLARLNASGQNISSINFVQGSLFLPLRRLRLRGKCDFIVSNPPYVSRKEWTRLPREISDYEPMRALVAGKTGLEIIQKLALEAPNYLKPGGSLLFEIGYFQKDEVKSLLHSNPSWEDIDFFKDLSGNWRVALGKTSRLEEKDAR